MQDEMKQQIAEVELYFPWAVEKVGEAACAWSPHAAAVAMEEAAGFFANARSALSECETLARAAAQEETELVSC